MKSYPKLTRLENQALAIRDAVTLRDAPGLKALYATATQTLYLAAQSCMFDGTGHPSVDSWARDWAVEQSTSPMVEAFVEAMAVFGGPTLDDEERLKEQLSQGKWAPWQVFRGMKTCINRDQIAMAEHFLPYLAKVDHGLLLGDQSADLSLSEAGDLIENVLRGMSPKRQMVWTAKMIVQAVEQECLPLAKRLRARGIAREGDDFRQRLWPALNVAALMHDNETFARWLVADVGVSPLKCMREKLFEQDWKTADFLACQASGDLLRRCLSQAEIWSGKKVPLPRTRARIESERREAMAQIDSPLTGTRRPRPRP